MASKELSVIDHFDNMNKVVTEYLKGEINPLVIGKQLNMQRKEVVAYLDEWKALARNSVQVQERAKDAIAGADQHYSMLIKQFWDIVEEATLNADTKSRLAALGSLATVEEKRINMLQKAGLLDNQELAEQVAERQKNEQILLEILRETARRYPDASAWLRSQIARITHEPEGLVIEQAERVG